MEPGHAEQLEYILGNVAVGVAILDAASLRIRYVNSYLHALLGTPWNTQDVQSYSLEHIIPAKLHNSIIPLLQQVASSGERVLYAEVPYEGFLETRGRTYWRISLERMPAFAQQTGASAPALLINVEDVTTTVRTRLHVNAIHSISSAIAGPSSLHPVLERILHVLQEMVGSKRCAVILISQPPPEPEAHFGTIRPTYTGQQTAIVAAQKGVHPRSQDWHPTVDEHILLGRVVHEQRTLLITDTGSTPEIDFPFIIYKGSARRPGSVLCVPIFEPRPQLTLEAADGDMAAHSTTVLGSIEVYHRRTRGFPAEEVELLERFAQQAGLAIQNARLFRSIDRWARTASRHNRQKENIMQAIPDGVIIYDPRWRIADANHAARALFGWSEDIIGQPMLQAIQHSSAIFQPDFLDEPDPIEILEQRALSGQVDEFKMVSAVGKPCTMRCTYTPIRDELGDTFAFITIFHDVTREVAARERIEAEVVVRTAELKQRNLALQQSRIAQELTSARMRLLLEHLPSGVILVAASDSSISVINPHAVQMLQSIGIPLEPLDDPDEASRRAIGMNCEDVLDQLQSYDSSGTYITPEERPLHLTLRYGTPGEAEFQLTRADGQELYLLVNTAALRDPAGTVTSAILVFQEITRIKALENAREDFFTTMAHELKTPLANIRAHLSALLARDLQWSGEEQYDFLQTADAQVERLVDMINHFLDASRVEAGALRLELEPIIIAELFEDLQDRLDALITSSRRSLHISIAAPMPAALGDYELVISVLSNLLSNAFRYAPEGEAVQLSAEPIFATAQPPGIRLSVTDRGPGISQEQQEALFTRFSTFAAMSRPSQHRPGQPTLARRQQATRWSPSTGLGLYISRGIIEAHGSELMLTSNPGQGACFAFTLPVFQGKKLPALHYLSDEGKQFLPGEGPVS